MSRIKINSHTGSMVYAEIRMVCTCSAIQNNPCTISMISKTPFGAYISVVDSESREHDVTPSTLVMLSPAPNDDEDEVHDFCRKTLKVRHYNPDLRSKGEV